MIRFLIFLVMSVILGSGIAHGNNNLPRFMSLKVSEANVRTGPSVKFPIKWILIKENIVVEVFDSFDNWYKIRDEENQEGWIHKSLVSPRRFFVVSQDNSLLYQNPQRDRVLYRVESGVRGRILSCRSKWCSVKIDKMQGWIQRSDIWGVYTKEVIK